MPESIHETIEETMPETMPETKPDEEIVDGQISTVLMGEFDQSWFEFLQWKNTYPVSAHVKFMHIEDIDNTLVPEMGVNYWHNPTAGFIKETLAASLVTFIVVSKAVVRFQDVLDMAIMAKLLTPLTIMYIAHAQLSGNEIEQLKATVNSLILSPQERYVNGLELPLEKVQQQIHQSNDLTIIASIEALTNTIFRPDLATICVDFVDIKEVFSDKTRGYIASAVDKGSVNKEGEGRSTRVTRKVVDNPMMQDNLPNAKGIYALINYGVDHIELAEFNEVINVIQECTSAEANVVIGLRYNKYLAADEVQLVVMATCDA